MSNVDWNKTMDWPYPVAYGKENEVETDVLVLGGGIAGSHAAINAVKRGAKVTVVEKGATIRSGSGGAGVDHWHGAFTNPCSKITPEEMMELIRKSNPGYLFYTYGNEITSYILFKESYDALLDLENWGIEIRDVNDEFKGAEFRDDATKLMFAYDYENRYTIRAKGAADVKVALYNEMKRQRVKIYDRVMATSLLTEGGEPGGRVIGATGLNTRTGEFYIFKAKATIISTSGPFGMWVFSSELIGSSSVHDDPNDTGEGTNMAWQAGAELTLLERSNGPVAGGFSYPPFGVGSAGNTWYPCNMVDANGKEIPWVDRDGRVLKTISERCHPAPGQKIFIHGFNLPYEFRGPSLVPDLSERIKKGEYVLPLFADLPGMPAHERRAIWGLMIGNEGKTRQSIYGLYQNAGFDPDKDMLQALSPDLQGAGPPQWREPGFSAGSGIVFDWDLKTSLEGLYVAGQSTYVGGNHAVAATTGRYSGRKAAVYAQTAKQAVISREQVEKEKTRIYAPVTRTKGVGWKELRGGLARIMQNYLGEYKNEENLKIGLRWLDSIRESEAAKAYARNPHELAHTVENMTRLSVGEIMMQASLNRKASSKFLDFKRIDYPEIDPPEWNKLVTLRLSKEGNIKVGELPLDYCLQKPNASTYEENYQKHCSL